VKNIPERHRQTDRRTDNVLWHDRALQCSQCVPPALNAHWETTRHWWMAATMMACKVWLQARRSTEPNLSLTYRKWFNQPPIHAVSVRKPSLTTDLQCNVFLSHMCLRLKTEFLITSNIRLRHFHVATLNDKVSNFSARWSIRTVYVKNYEIMSKFVKVTGG